MVPPRQGLRWKTVRGSNSSLGVESPGVSPEIQRSIVGADMGTRTPAAPLGRRATRLVRIREAAPGYAPGSLRVMSPRGSLDLTAVLLAPQYGIEPHFPALETGSSLEHRGIVRRLASLDSEAVLVDLLGNAPSKLG